MTLGARPGLDHLFRDFNDRVQFVSVYTREAHPGENYPHHTSDEQKLRHARDWAKQDQVPWPVAVDTLDGRTHRAYGPVPNSAYLIGRAGRVAFRALWAGQEGLLRDRIEELLANETEGEVPVVLGEEENLVLPLLHGGVELDRALSRSGEKAKEDFRREMGSVAYAFQELMSAAEPVVNPGNRKRR